MRSNNRFRRLLFVLGTVIVLVGALTFTSAANAFTSPSDCSKVMADALNAGYHLRTSLALPNGGPGGTGATEYVFVRGGNQ
jgi:hypothetical protein